MKTYRVGTSKQQGRRVTETIMRALGPLVMAIILSGCELAGGGGGTGGGSGGGGGMMGAFTKGYVFVRKDDRNVYLADEKNLQQTTRLTTSGFTRHPSISSDGKRVVFVRQDGADTEVATVATSGGASTAVLRSSAMVKNLRNPVFSKDTTKIFFAYDINSASALGVVNLDGSGFKSVAGGPTFSYASPSLYADGLSVLVGGGNSASSLTQLEKIDAASGAPQNVTNTLGTIEGQAVVNRVVLSPDGTRAVYDGRVASQSSRRNGRATAAISTRTRP